MKDCQKNKYDYLEIMKEYSGLSTWAIWESHQDDEKCLHEAGKFFQEKDMNVNIDFSDYKEKLQPIDKETSKPSNYVILGMNPGGDFGETDPNKATRKDKVIDKPWGSFHTANRSRDYLLAEALRSTFLYGCYLTDLFPIKGSNSNEIINYIENHKEQVKRLIKEFDEELGILLPEENQVHLFCLGRTTEKWAKKYLEKNELGIDLKKQYKTYYLPHYSGSNRSVTSKPGSEGYYPDCIKERLESIKATLNNK